MINRGDEKPGDEHALQIFASLANGKTLQETGFRSTRQLRVYVGRLGLKVEQIAIGKWEAKKQFMQDTAFLETKEAESICEREKQLALSDQKNLSQKVLSEFTPLYRTCKQYATLARRLSTHPYRVIDDKHKQEDHLLFDRLNKFALYLDAVSRTLRDRQQDRQQLPMKRFGDRSSHQRDS